MAQKEVYKLATLGGGCFWCLEAIFDGLKGVVSVESGYSGGELANPSYEEVSTGTTGHAEVVQITYNPEIISYRDILEIFFAIHDPTQLNRQGNDIGPQYRSIILYHSQQQKKTIKGVVKHLEETKVWKAPIVTEISSFEIFYRAEKYHQNYFKNNSNQPYCQFVIAPKIAKFRKTYVDKLVMSM